jgi:hypothetical protein
MCALEAEEMDAGNRRKNSSIKKFIVLLLTTIFWIGFT